MVIYEYQEELKYMLAEAPQQVVFTKSGTYMVFYGNGTLAVSTWKWQDESKGTARYSWNYESIDDPDASGLINIGFADNQLVIKEYLIDGESADEYLEAGVSVDGYIEYFLTEAQ